jgi:hypothetical protein
MCVKITSATRHQQCFRTRNTKVNKQGRCYPDHAERERGCMALTRENPRTGEAMRRELLMNDSVFIVYS